MTNEFRVYPIFTMGPNLTDIYWEDLINIMATLPDDQLEAINKAWEAELNS